MAMPGVDENLSRIYILMDKLYSNVLKIFDTIRQLRGDVKRDVTARYVDETVSLCEELKNEITREAVLFIARYQPLGRELIQAENTIKASYDLYRITRYLREIAHLDRKVGPLSTLLTEHDWALLDQARTMLEKGYRLYRQGEGDAMEILEADNIIDRAYEEILDEISQSENVEKRKAVEALYRRHVERIADHIVYIVTKII